MNAGRREMWFLTEYSNYGHDDLELALSNGRREASVTCHLFPPSKPKGCLDKWGLDRKSFIVDAD